MARSIQQIKNDLEILEANTLEAGTELQDLYKSYLDSLSESAKQQLILASYQICTQFDPESFLGLSLSQKQKLQHKLRECGQELQPELLNSQKQTELISERNDLSFVAELIKNLPLAQNKGEEDTEAEAEEDDLKILEIIKTELAELEISQLKASIANDSPANSSESQTQEIDFKNPEHLVLWHKQVEKAIKKALDHASQEVNKLLQESGIIPRRLPAKIMEVAIRAEENSSRVNNRKVKQIPNILNIVIETDKDKKSKLSSIAQINLLRLRLLEIEFADPLLSAKRNQIRIMVNKLKQLLYQYRDKKQEYTVAEAEAAWRSSWYED